MSKKLIAVASAAALALSALVATPAAANVVFDIQNSESGTGSGTAKAPIKHIALDQTTLLQDTDVLEITVDVLEDEALAVSTTGGVKVLSKVTNAATDTEVEVGAGSDRLSLKGNSDDEVTFYAYTTSTTVGTVVLNYDGNSTRIYVASEVGQAFDLSGVVPTSLAVLADNVYAQLTVKDIFGNVVNNDNKAENGFVTGDIVRSQTGAVTAEAISWDSKSKTWRSKLTNTTAGPGAVNFVLAEASVYEGARDQKRIVFGSVNSLSPDAQIAELTAQVAAIKANRVTKKRYNTLARKWNAAFPSQRVALKK